MHTTIFKYNSRHEPVQTSEYTLSDSIGANEVLVQTKFAALNPLDLKLKSVNILGSGYPVHEFSGQVLQAGASSGFQPGEKVCGLRGLGTIGSLTKLSTLTSIILKQPETLGGAEAAGLTVSFGTAFGLLRAAPPTQDSRVLVLGGASCVGISTIQLLKKHYRVAEVVASCSSSSNKYVQSYGADKTIDYTRDYSAQIKAHGPYDNIYDCVGGYEPVQVAPEVLKSGGTYVTCAGDPAPGSSYSAFNVPEFIGCNLRMTWRMVFGRFYGLKYKFVPINKSEWPGLAAQIVDECKIKVPVDSVYRAQDVAQAWSKLDGGKAKGKVLLEFDEPSA